MIILIFCDKNRVIRFSSVCVFIISYFTISLGASEVNRQEIGNFAPIAASMELVSHVTGSKRPISAIENSAEGVSGATQMKLYSAPTVISADQYHWTVCYSDSCAYGLDKPENLQAEYLLCLQISILEQNQYVVLFFKDELLSQLFVNMECCIEGRACNGGGYGLFTQTNKQLKDVFGLQQDPVVPTSCILKYISKSNAILKVLPDSFRAFEFYLTNRASIHKVHSQEGAQPLYRG